jgi:hypothetical protein
MEQQHPSENMDQHHGMPNAETTSPESTSVKPHSATSIHGSWPQDRIPSPSSTSLNVLQVHATPNSQGPSPIQESNLAWQRVPEGDPMAGDVSDGFFSSRVNETDHHLYQSNNSSFQIANSSHSARYVAVHYRRPQSSHDLRRQLYQL